MGSFRLEVIRLTSGKGSPVEIAVLGKFPVQALDSLSPLFHTPEAAFVREDFQGVTRGVDLVHLFNVTVALFRPRPASPPPRISSGSLGLAERVDAAVFGELSSCSLVGKDNWAYVPAIRRFVRIFAHCCRSYTTQQTDSYR